MSPPLLMPFRGLIPSVVLLLLSLVCSTVHTAVTVTHLPGFSGALPFHLETGYVKVDETDGVELFYYFIRSEGNPLEDPVMLWHSGGPGCSAFTGLVCEIGPLKFVSVEYNGSIPSLVYNPYTWTKVCNIIFLDSPVGAGFSFSKRGEGYEVGDITSSKQVYKFLRKWFIDHPQYLSNPLYIGGDSYGGKVTPIITYEIAQGIEAEEQPILNLQGYMVGNPVTGELVDHNSQVQFANGMGIISDELYELIEENCKGEDYVNPQKEKCIVNLGIFNKFISEIDEAHILEPKCVRDSPKPKDIKEDRRSLSEKYANLVLPPPAPSVQCRSYIHYLVYYWANNQATRDALHIKEGTVEEWVRCNYDIPYTQEVPSSVKYHFNLTTRGYRALAYSGDHDLSIPFIGTEAWIKSLNFSITDDWRSWHAGGQVAGYTRSYTNNLTFATIKGAGHTAVEYRPRQGLDMIRRWFSHEPL